MALIDIGSRKQLFVDDYLIESMTNTRQVLNPAEKVENNPVLKPERPWEGNDVRPRRIVFDDRDGVYKMWYEGRLNSARQGDGEIIVTGEADAAEVKCLAVSEDGVHWERPNLGLVEFGGSKNNNLLPRTHMLPYGPDMTTYFFKDTHEEDPSRRYKGLVRTGSTTTPGMVFDLYFSEDAFKWFPYKDNPIIDTSPKVGRWGPTNFMGWDPIREVYAAHIENCLHRRAPLGKRLIGRAESPDMVHWSEPETILIPDEQDTPDTEFYAMPTMTYEGMYVGLLWIFRTTNTTHHPEVVFSRDGIHYNRQYREPFIQRGARWEFDCTSIYARTPVVQDDRILFFYEATNWRSPETLLALGDRATAAVGLAALPLDGFVSLDGAKGQPGNRDKARVAPYSEMVTRSFGFSGSRLHVNVATALQQWGAEAPELRVEVLEPNHDTIAGYTFDDCDPVTESGQSRVVSWRGDADLGQLAGKAVKLRFYFKNCKLYSYQFK